MVIRSEAMLQATTPPFSLGAAPNNALLGIPSRNSISGRIQAWCLVGWALWPEPKWGMSVALLRCVTARHAAVSSRAVSLIRPATEAP